VMKILQDSLYCTATRWKFWKLVKRQF